MRTTLDIPQDLIDEAMRVTGAKTKSQLVKVALQNQIDRIKQHKILSSRGKLTLDIDLDTTRNRL